MKQEIIKIRIADLVNGYKNSDEEGVVAYGGKLDVRPPYQREFVYKDKQRDAVLATINNDCFLGVFHWAKNEDGSYEVLDGQQRTISICEYVSSQFSINDRYFHNLFDDEKAKILNYEILINVVEGTNSEKLKWFDTINICGEKLTNQELRNAVYIGSWLSDAKKKFSKKECVAYKLANKYLKGSPIRQEYLETALDWISDGKIEEYMSNHQHDATATDLWIYFQSVISWVKDMFNYRKEMQSINWGELYNKYHTNTYNPSDLEKKVAELMANEEVTDKKGIYEYVLSGEKEEIARKLSKRAFSESDKRTAYEKQNGICPICHEHHDFEDMEGDHIVPWWRGGKTTLDNLQMLCKKCNGNKGGRTLISNAE